MNSTKKAQALSINFLVKFILAIVLFGLGVSFMWMIFNHGKDLADSPSRDFDEKLFALNCDGKSVICIGASSIDAKRGKSYLVDFEIFNNYNKDLNGVKVFVELRDTDDEFVGSLKGISILPSKQELNVPGLSSTKGSFLVKVSKETPKIETPYTIRMSVLRPGYETKYDMILLYIK